MKTFSDVGMPVDELLQRLGSLVHVMDAQGNVLYANEHWLQRLGYHHADIPQLNFVHHILHEDHRAALVVRLAQEQCDDCTVDVETFMLTRDGDSIKVEGSFIPCVEDGQLQSVIAVLRDVTPHHTMEIELRQMFMMSVDMLGIADFNGYFIKLNPAWEQTLGHTLEDLMSQPFINFVHPADQERTRLMIQNIHQATNIQTLEHRCICRDGRVKWLSWHYIAYPQLQKFYFVARDITRRKQDEQLLIEARDQLQSILDNSGTVIGLKDTSGRYILVNREFADRFGRGDKESIIGQTDEDIFTEDVASILYHNDLQVLQAKETMQFEEPFPDEDGMHTYLSTKFVLKDTDGNAYAVCMIAKDITYRKLTEIQLMLRNQAIEYSPTGISIADARLPDMPLIYVNPAFEQTTGYSALDAIGRNCRFLQNDDRDQDGVYIIRQALEQEKSCTVVLRNYRKDGELFYNELSLAPIHNDAGQLTHYVGISTDVTNRVQAEAKIQAQNQALFSANQELAQARQEAEQAAQKVTQQNEALISANQDLANARKEAEDATRLKSQFLATMSHELRTPLNAIIGYSEIILAGMTGEITDEQKDYQERILANADHLLALINDVLDISKIEAGRLEMVNKTYHLPKWLDDLVAQTRVLAEEKDLDFRVNIDPRMPDYIVGDPARIRQIVINLLSNAAKFTDAGYISLNLRKHGRDAFKIIVEDTGVGIPSHLQETIFEEFRQVDSSHSRKAGGTGLGLSIVRKLVLMMGGNIRVKSQVEEGSMFEIILPLIAATEDQINAYQER